VVQHQRPTTLITDGKRAGFLESKCEDFGLLQGVWQKMIVTAFYLDSLVSIDGKILDV
jgi:hypothetical protein